MSDSIIEAPFMDAHYQSLGKLCVAWAVIDRQLNDVLAAMIGCSDAAAACIATVSDTVGSRCTILRKLVYEKPISAKWADDFAGLMDLISQQLGPKRNRFIHDWWSLSEGTLTRLDRRAFTLKGQSRKPIELKYDVEHVTDPYDVDLLWIDVENATFVLHCALRDLQDWKNGGLLPTPPLLARGLSHLALQDSLQRSDEAEPRQRKSLLR